MPVNGASIGGGFTEGELKFASFWVRNKPTIRKAVRIAFIIVNVGLWGYVLWGILDAYAISYPRESRITADIAQDQVTMDALESNRPQNVRAANVLVLTGTDGRYDMAVDVENPNAQWWAEFTYRFNFSGEQTSMRNGFILPGSKTVLTELGFRPKGRGGATAQLVVDGIRWHRVDPAQVGASYKDYELERSNVAFENVTYQGGLIVGTKEVGRTSFDMKNRGSFGFWAYDVVVRLYRGSTIVGVNRIS
ncbi:hypothetical protein KJ781_02470, partial [Patescibacteria group bacterium]|nr:hypothetical protein [Patescibacteria group bacterium]MBU1448979.1 hypothetical protein [Patescibacteria group bacterium]